MECKSYKYKRELCHRYRTDFGNQKAIKGILVKKYIETVVDLYIFQIS